MWLGVADTLSAAAKAQLLEALVASLDDTIALRDTAGNLLFANRPVSPHESRDDDGLSVRTVVDVPLAAPLAAALGVVEPSLRLDCRSPVSNERGVVGRILQQLPAMFFVGRGRPGLEFVNDGLVRFTGRSADFFLNCDPALPAEQQSLHALVHPADIGRIGAVFRAYHDAASAASTGGTDSPVLPSEEECRILAADGTYRWCRAYIARLGCAELRPGQVELVVYVVDIQELKDLQAQVEDERALLTAAINQLPVGCAVVKPTGAISLFNHELRRMFAGAPVGTTNSVEQYGEWVGYHPDGRRYEAMDWPLARSLVKGEVVAGEDHIIGLSDGSRGVARVNTAPVYSSSGTLIAGVMVVEDVTQEKQRAEDRTHFEAVQRAADAMRSLMVSNWSVGRPITSTRRCL